MITIAENSLLNGPPTGCLVFIFNVRINSVFPLGCTLRTGSLPTKRFRDFDYILMVSITQQSLSTIESSDTMPPSCNAVCKTVYLRNHALRYQIRYRAPISLKIYSLP